MNDLCHRRLEAQIAPVSVQAGVIRETLSVAAEVDLIVGLVEVSETGDELGLVVTFKASPGDNIENSISAVAVLGFITATLHFEIVNVLGIKLRPDVRSDVGVGHRNTIHQPSPLVAAADVKLIVGEIRAGNKVRNDGKAVGTISSWGSLDVDSVYEGGGRGRIRRHNLLRGG